jgi:hypothetical protein
MINIKQNINIYFLNNRWNFDYLHGKIIVQPQFILPSGTTYILDRDG